MRDDDSRTNLIFQLREVFPQHSLCPSKFATYEEAPKPQPVLNYVVKRILARTASEANAMRDYWIDTEHLLLGTLGEPTCLAAQHLAKAGISLRSARRAVIENKPSRPNYGPVPEEWSL